MRTVVLRKYFRHAACLSLEYRKALLDHECGDITTHYSAPELAELIRHVELICVERPSSVLRLASPTKSPAKVVGIAALAFVSAPWALGAGIAVAILDAGGYVISSTLWIDDQIQEAIR